MRVGIVGFCNLSIMQYLYKYTNVLDREGITYDVMYWNRMGIYEEPGFCGKAICYERTLDTYQPFYKKITAFFRYTHFLKKTIKQNRYDRLIVLTTQPAVAISSILLKKYKNKYIFDYRDITKEKESRRYADLVRKLIDSASVTMMSSRGFMKELELEDTDKVVMAHNTHRQPKGKLYRARVSEKEPIRIAFWGTIRQLEHNKKICDCFGKDPRFFLSFHGIGVTEELAAYCKEKGYTNVVFAGRYTLSDVESFVQTTDIIHSIYENDMIQRAAMPVKAYDAMQFCIPMLVAKGSHLSETLQCMESCFPVDVYDGSDVSEQVYNWYRGLTVQQIEEAYARWGEAVAEDDQMFEQQLLLFCQKQ